MINGKLETFTDYRDIPEIFQHIIKFQPDIPPPPHSEEQHQEIDVLAVRLKELIEKEKKLNGY